MARESTHTRATIIIDFSDISLVRSVGTEYRRVLCFLSATDRATHATHPWRYYELRTDCDRAETRCATSHVFSCRCCRFALISLDWEGGTTTGLVVDIQRYNIVWWVAVGVIRSCRGGGPSNKRNELCATVSVKYRE